jgi:hypothetical protein
VLFWDWPSSLASNFQLEVAFQFYPVQWSALSEKFCLYFDMLSKLFNKALCLGNLKANVTPCNFCYNLQNLHSTFQITVRTCSNCNFLNAPSTFQINFHLLVSCEIISILSEWSTAFQMYERFVHQSTYRLSSKPEVE